MTEWSVYALVVGCGLVLLSSGRGQVGLAAWLAPAFLLSWSRSEEVLVGLGGVLAVLFVASLISSRHVMPIRGAAYVVTTAVQSLIGVVPFALDRLLVSELSGFAGTLLFPAAWVTLEFISARSSPFGTWGSVAYTQHDNLPLMQLASVTGIWGITFIVTWFGSTLSWVAQSDLESSAVHLGLAVYALVLVAVMLAGAARIATTAASHAVVRVAAIEPTGQLLQPAQLMAILASDRATKADRDEDRRTLTRLHDALLTASEREIRAGAAIVVWPEASAPVFADEEAHLLDRARTLARHHGANLLLGIVTVQTGPPLRLENKAILIDPSGDIAFAYRKARPVPGWEAQVSVAGDGRIPVRASASGRLAAAICYDLDFPEFIRQVGRAKADLLLVPASDWPEIGHLHHAMASFRAVENGVSLVRAARWGVSAVVDPVGRVLAITDHRSPGADAVIAYAPVMGRRTIYARIGDAFGWLSSAATGASAGWGLLSAVGIV